MELTKEEKIVLAEVLYYTKSNQGAFESVAENLDLEDEYLEEIINKGIDFFALCDGVRRSDK